MKKITIRHFGPIENVSDLQLEDAMLFIGPQANGKSTIAKAVYFFKQIRIDLIQYFLQKIDTNEVGNAALLTELVKIIRAKFLDFWGSSYAHHPSMVLHYDYTQTIFINITSVSGGQYVNPGFSTALQAELSSVFDDIKFFRHRTERNTVHLSPEERLIRESEIHAVKLNIVKRINDLFEEDEELLFVPAGRSIFAILSDEIASHNGNMDALIRDFAHEIKNIKVYFNKPLGRVISDEQSTSLRTIPVKKAQKSVDLLSRILQGEYRIVNGEERIYYNDDRFVQLNYASSGQQESLWILLSIFIKILKSIKVFVVFEEPEAHLFPKAQKDIVELIALLMNTTKGNKVMITTHSPYVLTAFNNLIYANEIGKEHPDHTNSVVDKDFWLDAANSAAYFVEKGTLKSIINDGLIDANQIDGVSDEINNLADRMVDIKFP